MDLQLQINFIYVIKFWYVTYRSILLHYTKFIHKTISIQYKPNIHDENRLWTAKLTFRYRSVMFASHCERAVRYQNKSLALRQRSAGPRSERYNGLYPGNILLNVQYDTTLCSDFVSCGFVRVGYTFYYKIFKVLFLYVVGSYLGARNGEKSDTNYGHLWAFYVSQNVRFSRITWYREKFIPVQESKLELRLKKIYRWLTALHKILFVYFMCVNKLYYSEKLL